MAFSVPAQPDNYVNDYAHLLSPAASQRLNEVLGDFEKRTSNQLVVVTVPNLDNQPIEYYSIHLAERWKIGTHQHDNGIILLLSKAEHKIRIEVGYGLEGALPDAIAEQIIQNEISPALMRGDFDGGIEAGVNAIMQATQNEYHAKKISFGSLVGETIFLIVMGFLSLRFIGILRTIILSLFGLSSHIHTPFWDFFTSGSGSGGGGGFSGSGFGFGGGGGGSFGGGGASGSW